MIGQQLHREVTTVITRFAPSPTGSLHIGGARTALFNWLYARHCQGCFYLRIEDTDSVRSTKASVETILAGLHWLGITWDGEVIFQSAHAARHVAVVRQLLDCGMAYRCYCTPEELTIARGYARQTGQLTTGYDGRCRDRDPADILLGIKPTIRLRMPREGTTILNDLVQGRVEVANEQLDDMILLRADGTPTYMLSVVVDDHDMGISHIIRGDDHLTNAFRQIQIYLAMEWHIPQFAHIPLIHASDGTKMSKRHGAVGTETYCTMGILPEAMRNYLIRLGWGHGNMEIFTTEQAIRWFDLKKVGRSAARFDTTKLVTLNAHYLRETDDLRLSTLIVPHLRTMLGRSVGDIGLARLLAAMPSLKTRAHTVVELARSALFYVQERPISLDDAARQQICLTDRAVLTEVIEHITATNRVWQARVLENDIRRFAVEKGLSLSKVAQFLRASLTGRTASPPIFEIMQILGREETLERLTDILSWQQIPKDTVTNYREVVS